MQIFCFSYFSCVFRIKNPSIYPKSQGFLYNMDLEKNKKTGKTNALDRTEYTVDAHFRKDGRDLLSKLTDIFMRGMQGYECYNDGDWSGDDGA